MKYREITAALALTIAFVLVFAAFSFAIDPPHTSDLNKLKYVKPRIVGKSDVHPC